MGEGWSGRVTECMESELGGQGIHYGKPALIDDGGFADMRIGECVPPDIRRPLHELGLLEAFLNERHEPCLGL